MDVVMLLNLYFVNTNDYISYLAGMNNFRFYSFFFPFCFFTLILRSTEASSQSSSAGTRAAIITFQHTEFSCAGTFREPTGKDLLHLLQNW